MRNPARQFASLRRLFSYAMILILLTALIPTQAVRAETIISGNITQNTSWSGDLPGYRGRHAGFWGEVSHSAWHDGPLRRRGGD